MSEILVYYNEFYSLPREEFMTLFQKELISSRILDCFFILLNYAEVKQDNEKPRFFFGGEHMLSLLRSVFNGEGCIYENEIFGAWDMWIESVQCCESVDALLIFIPIYYGNHYSAVCINFYTQTVDYLANQTYSMQVEVENKPNSKKGKGANKESTKKFKISTKFDEFHTDFYTLVFETLYVKIFGFKRA